MFVDSSRAKAECLGPEQPAFCHRPLLVPCIVPLYNANSVKAIYSQITLYVPFSTVNNLLYGWF